MQTSWRYQDKPDAIDKTLLRLGPTNHTKDVPAPLPPSVIAHEETRATLCRTHVRNTMFRAANSSLRW